MTTITVAVTVTLPDSFTQAELAAIFTTLAIPATAVITKTRPPALPAQVVTWNMDVTF